MKLDLSFANTARVLPKEFSKLKIYLIGAGGTGSFAAMNLARLLFEINRIGKAADLTIIDPDIVESGNIPRSNFCAAEIGRLKAQTLAERITLAWGLEVAYSNETFSYEKHIKPNRNSYKELTVLIGCVDNHLARREIHRSLEEANKYNSHNAPECWWIDGGNGKFSGQVLIGSEVRREKAENHFSSSTICKKLPAPSVIHPELLENQEIPLPRESSQRMSCAERIMRGEQSLNINQRVAVEIGEMLTELLLTNSLRRFATYFDLDSGTSRSSYCTPENISEALQIAKTNKPKGKSRSKSGG
ncbi:MAG TPA: ThiF family adenylyltransferase, partial [Pyrinomonadaceae bacterium]|nr:ThiF family adenylyltransferase [Pyrinomonadaceae bacterium]